MATKSWPLSEKVKTRTFKSGLFESRSIHMNKALTGKCTKSNIVHKALITIVFSGPQIWVKSHNMKTRFPLALALFAILFSATAQAKTGPWLMSHPVLKFGF